MKVPPVLDESRLRRIRAIQQGCTLPHKDTLLLYRLYTDMCLTDCSASRKQFQQELDIELSSAEMEAKRS